MGQSIYTVAASHDDSFWTGVCENEADFLQMKTSGSMAGLRFLSVLLTGGHKVLSSYLRFRAYSDGVSSTLHIVGIKQANPGAWENPNCNPDDRPITTADVLWVTGARSNGTWYNSDDLSAIIQELLEQATRVSGDALAFSIVTTLGTPYFYAYDAGDHSSAPQLVVNWTPKVAGFIL